MYKNASYKEKYAEIQEWLPLIIETVKKDLKNEHLKKDFLFIKKYLATKNINKLTTQDLTEAYQSAIANEDNGEALAEFITSRWLMNNSELYDYFEQRLTQINPDFGAIEEIDMPTAQSIIKDSTAQFGAPHTYLFAILNSVVFPAEAFQKLKKDAKHDVQQKIDETSSLSEKMSIENSKKNQEREIARLTDKYEKKLSGLQKKYIVDTDSLKKQVAQLQRKLQEKS
ncbi:MAG: hypothetical protein H0W88_00760 [Parachlamydiaceae bacterium]|nr:hypothetical protein [Parachlamydiaceae bacterium]